MWQRILEANFTVPISFLDEHREVWLKRHNIAIFRKPSIEDFVEFFLSFLLHLRIADHRQEERQPPSTLCAKIVTALFYARPCNIDYNGKGSPEAENHYRRQQKTTHVRGRSFNSWDDGSTSPNNQLQIPLITDCPSLRVLMFLNSFLIG